MAEPGPQELISIRDMVKALLAAYNAATNDTGLLTHAILHLWAIEDGVIEKTPRELAVISTTLSVCYRSLGTPTIPMTAPVLSVLNVVAVELEVAVNDALTDAQAQAMMTAALRLATMMGSAANLYAQKHAAPVPEPGAGDAALS